MQLSITKDADRECRRAILSLIPYRATRVLDCGCDEGKLSKTIAELTNASEVWGLDRHEKALHSASQKGIVVCNADLNEKIPLPDSSFDLIISNQVIEHLTDTDRFLSELTRVLVPGGTVIISTMNLSSWHNIFFLMLGFQPLVLDVSLAVRVGNPMLHNNLTTRKQGEQLGHYRPFTLQSLKELVCWYGLHVEKTVGTGYYPFFGSISRLLSAIDKRHSVFATVKAVKPKKT
jgi:methionine biosynthesis protein MetW